MSARAILVDPTTGVILRVLSGEPTMFAQQVAGSELLFAITDDPDGLIDDRNLIISETGEWEVLPGAPEDFAVPTSLVELIAL
ncbi:hypothetical protein [Brevundimonas sp. FT23028]|uniref:hypothetical protein n=1 Tax=Brevundimonas sp. FT23028 TaxID=3393748 RepID=UPI003B586572